MTDTELLEEITKSADRVKMQNRELEGMAQAILQSPPPPEAAVKTDEIEKEQQEVEQALDTSLNQLLAEINMDDEEENEGTDEIDEDTELL